MFGFGFLGNTKIPHNKNTAGMPAVDMPPPKEVLLPLCQHIGAPATPVVSVGDEVRVGQRHRDTFPLPFTPPYRERLLKLRTIFGRMEERFPQSE